MRTSGIRIQSIAALLRRDFRISRSYPFAFLSDIFFGALNLGVFYFVSKTFGGASTSSLQGAGSYFEFAAVGVALTTVIQGASVGLSRQVREEQLTGTLEALVAQPTSATELSLGLAGFPFLFGMARAILYMGLAAPFLHVDASRISWVGLLVMFLVTAAAITSIGVALGALVLVFKRSEALVALVSFGLGALGGALFPVSQLGSFEFLSRLVPTRPAFDGVRAALFRGEAWSGSALGLAIFAVIALPLAIGLFSAALNMTRRRGSLSQY